MLNPRDRLRLIISRIIDELKALGSPRKNDIVFDAALRRTEIRNDSEIISYCFELGLQQVVRQIDQQEPRIVRQEQDRAERLAFLQVPHAQRRLILELRMDNVRCPLRNNEYINLYGPDRGTSIEIESAALAYNPLIKALARKRDLLMKLARQVAKEESGL